MTGGGGDWGGGDCRGDWGGGGCSIISPWAYVESHLPIYPHVQKQFGSPNLMHIPKRNFVNTSRSNVYSVSQPFF